MGNELIIVQRPGAALVQSHRNNYVLEIPRGNAMVTRELKRGTDFGNPVVTYKVKDKDGNEIEKTKTAFPQPILYKGGAEKIINDYQVFARYEIMSSVEDFTNGIFFYRFKCSLTAYDRENQREIVVCEGYGSSNSKEKKNLTQSGFDVANSSLKNARKRSMVDAAISLAGLSSIFTQDFENESFMEGANAIATQTDNDAITPAQRRRVFAIASTRGMTSAKTKQWLSVEGFDSTKDIKLKDYDGLCEKLESLPVSEGKPNAD